MLRVLGLWCEAWGLYWVSGSFEAIRVTIRVTMLLQRV